MSDKSAPVSADMTDLRSIAALYAKVMDTYEARLDLLFNNAGIGAPPVPFAGSEPRAMAGGGRTPTSPRRTCARSTPSGS